MEEVINEIAEPIKNWFLHHEFPHLAANVKLILLLLFCSGLIPFLKKIVKRVVSFFAIRKAAKNLSPYIDANEIDQATKYYVSTKGQNISPANELEPRNVHAFTAKISLIKFFLKEIEEEGENVHKHYLILADSGMGKSTFMINFYVKYTRLLFKTYKVKLLPLGNPNVDTEIGKIETPDKTILLLDAFDEDPLANADYKNRIHDLTKATWKFRYIFITSRSQFFPSENDEPKNTEVFKFSLDNERQYYFKKMYISPFDDKDVKKYINKKFPVYKPWLINRRRRAQIIISLCPNLIVRPMMLSYIDNLVENAAFKKIDLKSMRYLKVCDIYEILIDRWILRESKRVDQARRDQFISDMYKFSENLSLDMFMKQVERGGLFIEASEIFPFATENSIDLSEVELKGKSLLNRDASGKFKFAHKSILEYFLAKHAATNSSFAEGVLHFNGLDGFDLAKKFYNEMLPSFI